MLLLIRNVLCFWDRCSFLICLLMLRVVFWLIMIGRWVMNIFGLICFSVLVGSLLVSWVRFM